MELPMLDNDRFVSENGLQIIVQVLDTHAQKIVDAGLVDDALSLDDCDCVTYRTAPGIQQFK